MMSDMNTGTKSGTSNELAVDISHLTRRFRGKFALDDVSLQIPVGSIFGLVGLNGAGKTTLIRHIMGLLKAQDGVVRVLGSDPTLQPELTLKRVGYLTEEDSMPKWMRIGDLVDFARGLYPTWDDAYAKELCDTFEFTRGTKLKSLSKGQRARAGLLVAIAHRPELLVLDEPSSGLDPIARSDILEAIIRTVADDGRTVLFSSHLLDEVDRVCDSFALMSQAKIIETISVDELEASYVEIVCRPAEGFKVKEQSQGFGWKQNGDEWSAVIDPGAVSGLPDSIGIIEKRGITLTRWFAAAVRQDHNAGPKSMARETSDV